MTKLNSIQKNTITLLFIPFIIVVGSLVLLSFPAHALNLWAKSDYYIDTDGDMIDDFTNYDQQDATEGSIRSSVGAINYDPNDDSWDVGKSEAAVSEDGYLAISAEYYMPITAGRSGFGGMVSWDETFTNTSGSDQSYILDFHISEGVLKIIDHYMQPSLCIQYTIQILLDYSSIWHSSAMLEGNLDPYFHGYGGNLTKSGIDLESGYFRNEDYPGSGGEFGYTFGPFSSSLDLGTYADGESFDLRYYMDVSAAGAGIDTGGLASFGDPLNVTETYGFWGSVTSSDQQQPIPEPATMLLLGSGLVGLAGFRRSLRKR